MLGEQGKLKHVDCKLENNVFTSLKDIFIVLLEAKEGKKETIKYKNRPSDVFLNVVYVLMESETFDHISSIYKVGSRYEAAYEP